MLHILQSITNPFLSIFLLCLCSSCIIQCALCSIHDTRTIKIKEKGGGGFKPETMEAVCWFERLIVSRIGKDNLERNWELLPPKIGSKSLPQIVRFILTHAPSTASISLSLHATIFILSACCSESGSLPSIPLCSLPARRNTPPD